MKRLQIANCRLEKTDYRTWRSHVQSAISNLQSAIYLWALVLLVCSPISLAAAGELQGTVKVSGRTVEIQVQNQDGSPAAGVNVRLLYGRQQTAAVARTDAQGRWVHPVEQTGAYEAIVEVGSQVLRLPFMVLNDPAPVRVPWIILVPCLLCVIGSILLFVLGLRRMPAARARTAPERGLLWSTAVLLAVGAFLMGWAAWYEWHKPGPPIPAGPDLEKEARDFLRNRNVKPLSDSLERVLASSRTDRVKTMPHALLGKAAPDFELSDHRQNPWRLSNLLKQGPVVLVFYYGYHCNHCVGQLFALHDDIQVFREVGAQVITVSADPPELTRDRFRQYGEFAFPVLSDRGNKIAQVFGVHQPATEKTGEDLQHGTFVIGRDGEVHWAHHGNYPFTDNATLLCELARLEGYPPRD